jgi:hypothetical protein
MCFRQSSWIDGYIANENWLKGWKSIQQGVSARNPHCGHFFQASRMNFWRFSFKFFNFFRPAAPIELIWGKIAWKVVHAFVFAENNISGPIFWGSLGKMNPLEVSASVGTQKGTSSREMASFDV